MLIKLWSHNDFVRDITLDDHKRELSGQPIRSIPLPGRLILPLKQSKEAVTPCVKVGDLVMKGQALSNIPNTANQVMVHAPTSGKITSIDQDTIMLQPDGKDTWLSDYPKTRYADYQKHSPETLLKALIEAGLMGMGGAGFPTPAKLHTANKTNLLIINGAECEPYICCDDRLMQENPESIIRGAEMIAYILSAKKTVIAIEKNKPEAIAAMQKAAENTSVKIIPLEIQYPSGGEKQLIELITGKQVPSEKYATDMGIYCQNVATAHAINDFIREGKPLIERAVTVNGNAADKPGNYWVPIGTPIDHLLNVAGVQRDKLAQLVEGGCLLGNNITDEARPVLKTSNCLIAATSEELPQQPPEMPCIRCGLCAEVCPADLLPQQLYWYSKAKDFTKLNTYHLEDCIECGACAFVCPSQLRLVEHYRHAKKAMWSFEADQEKAKAAKINYERREKRIIEENAEKEIKQQQQVDETTIQATLRRIQERKSGSSPH